MNESNQPPATDEHQTEHSVHPTSLCKTLGHQPPTTDATHLKECSDASTEPVKVKPQPVIRTLDDSLVSTPATDATADFNAHVRQCEQCSGPDDGCEEGQRLEVIMLDALK